jgi:L-arabinokinase
MAGPLLKAAAVITGAPALVFYISGHGFGHASRDIEVINALHAIAPEVRLVVRTSAPRWLFDLTLRAPITWLPAECDTGVVQIDSLRLDAFETVRRAAAHASVLDDLAAREARLLRELQATLVVGDIPPLAFLAAHCADVPSIALGNFTWDWIYAAYPEALAAHPTLLERIRSAYAHAAHACRLPLGGGFDAFTRVERVPFVARRSIRTGRDVRERFGLPAAGLLVLASFGGYGLRDIDVGALAAIGRYTVVVTANVQAARRGDDCEGEQRTEAAGERRLPASVRFVDERAVYAAGYRYEDLVRAVDVVATKPGYGIIAECIANDTALLYTSRGRFVEYDVMVGEMPRYLRCGFISNEDLYAGRWEPALDAVLAQPAPPERPRVDGAEVVAKMLVACLG